MNERCVLRQEKKWLRKRNWVQRTIGSGWEDLKLENWKIRKWLNIERWKFEWIEIKCRPKYWNNYTPLLQIPRMKYEKPNTVHSLLQSIFFSSYYNDNIWHIRILNFYSIIKIALIRISCLTRDLTIYLVERWPRTSLKIWYLVEIKSSQLTWSAFSGFVCTGIGCQVMFRFQTWLPFGGNNPAKLLSALIRVRSVLVLET